MDVLSMTDDVMAVVWRTLDLPMKRFPSHLWLRIQHRLGDMLLTRAGDGGIVWRNRKVHAVAATLFSPARAGDLPSCLFPVYSPHNNQPSISCTDSHPLGAGQVLLRQSGQRRRRRSESQPPAPSDRPADAVLREWPARARCEDGVECPYICVVVAIITIIVIVISQHGGAVRIQPTAGRPRRPLLSAGPILLRRGARAV